MMDKFPPDDPQEPQQQQQQAQWQTSQYYDPREPQQQAPQQYQWQAPPSPMPPQYAPYQGQVPMMAIEPQKSWIATVLLCQLLGTLGVHRFYTGHYITGILQLLTFGGFGIWVLVDLVMIYADSFKDDMNMLLTRMERVRPNVSMYPPQVKD
ncbi:MAG: TM2 domain-containing protein [Ktedonobacteraceae bacterium]